MNKYINVGEIKKVKTKILVINQIIKLHAFIKIIIIIKKTPA